MRVMNICEYLQKHDLSQDEFAKKVGVSQGLVWQWINGKTKVRAERVAGIEEATNGEITRHDLRSDIFGERQAA